MSEAKRDPLLSFAKAITWFFIVMLGFVTGAILIGTPVVALKHAEIVTELADRGVTAGAEFTVTLVVTMICIAALLAAAVWFLRLLQKIIDSVRDGDPFAPVNAERLHRMAWITLGAFIASFPLSGMVTWIAKIAADAGEQVHAEVDFGGSTLLLSVVLFILARVFRHGAEMREDLEGTV